MNQLSEIAACGQTAAWELRTVSWHKSLRYTGSLGIGPLIEQLSALVRENDPAALQSVVRSLVAKGVLVPPAVRSPSGDRRPATNAEVVCGFVGILERVRDGYLLEGRAVPPALKPRLEALIDWCDFVAIRFNYV